MAGLITVLGLSPVHVLHAQGLPAPTESFELDQGFSDLLQQQQKDLIKGNGQKTPGLDPDWIGQAIRGMSRATPQQKDFAAAIGKESLVKAGIKQVVAAPVFDTLIFVSYSMPESELMDVLSWASSEKQTLVVMRGVPEGQSIPQGILNIQRLAAKLDPVPNITLDPTAFERYSVSVVPTIVALTKEQAQERALVPMKELPANEQQAKGLLQQATEDAKEQAGKPQAQVLAKVSGISNPKWLRDQISAGHTGDLGTHGPTLDIAEPDLIEVMKQRVAKIDWAQKRQAALDNFWNGQRYVELDRAFLPRTRRIDATVVATGDIKTSTGDFVARAGDRVNPLKTRPFTQAIVVFDARDKKQVELIAQRLPEIRAEPGVQRTVLITTGLDKDDGWDGYKAVTEKLDGPVFLLTPDVRDRFALEKVPSIITADASHFVVREIPVVPDSQVKEKIGAAGAQE